MTRLTKPECMPHSEDVLLFAFVLFPQEDDEVDPSA